MEPGSYREKLNLLISMQQSSKQAQSMFINTNNLIDNEENDEEDKKVENIR